MGKNALGAILRKRMFLGLSLLDEWVYKAWFKFSQIDYVIIISIRVRTVDSPDYYCKCPATLIEFFA
jgi:hypothetical protein